MTQSRTGDAARPAAEAPAAPSGRPLRPDDRQGPTAGSPYDDREGTPGPDPLDLDASDLLAAPVTESLRQLLEIAATVTGIPNAAVNILDETWQTPVAQVGTRMSRVPRSETLCQVGVDCRSLVHTADATVDDRFPHKSTFGPDDAPIRRYAGAPLLTDSGASVGTLCVYERTAGDLDTGQLELLQHLADQAMSIFRLHATGRALQAELDRGASQDRQLRHLLDAAPDAFVRLDGDGRILTLSPSASALFAVDPADAVGRSALDVFVPTELHDRAVAAFASARGEGLIRASSRVTLLRSDGVRRTCDVSAWTETDPDVRINLFIRDVTDDDARSRALVDAEKRWRLAFDAAPIGMALQRVDAAGVHYEQVNRALCEMTGYSAAELLRLGPMGITVAEDRSTDETTAQEFIGGSRTSYFRDKCYTHADGHTVDVSVSSVIVHSDADTATVVTQVQDVSALHRLLGSLEEKAALLDLTREAIIVRDSAGVVSFWNHGAEELYGLPAARTVGRVTHQLLETSFPAPLEDIEAALEADGHWEGRLVHTTVDGSRRTVSSRWVLDRRADGTTAIMEVNSDVTAESAAENARREAEELFQLAFVHAPRGMGLLGTSGDDRGRWLEANEALHAIWSRDDLVGTSLADLFDDPAVAADVMGNLRPLLRGERSDWRGTWQLPTAGGHRYVAAECTLATTQTAAGSSPVVVVQLEDVTRKRAREQWLQRQATRDPLTGLLNRLAFNERLEAELELLAGHGRPLALLFCDLDGFKAVNDTAGHAAGDEVLREVAQRVVTEVPDGAVVARLGGDEYVVLVPDLDRPGAESLAAALTDAVRVAPAQHPELEVTVSIGWSVAADAGVAGGEMMRQADRRMYEVKQAHHAAPARPVVASS